MRTKNKLTAFKAQSLADEIERLQAYEAKTFIECREHSRLANDAAKLNADARNALAQLRVRKVLG